MDLNAAWIYVRVVQAGSFSLAARQLTMPVSTVSTKIAQLEKRLGVSLIRRTTRKLHLTDAGERYFQHAVRAVSELQAAEASTTQDQADLQGKIRITAPVEMGMSTLSDTIAAFLRLHPKVQIDLLITDRFVDLIGEGVDLAVRAGELKNSSLVVRKLGMTCFQGFASPAYLKKIGEPRRPVELSQMDCLRFTVDSEDDVWELRKGEKRVEVPVRGQFSSNNLMSLHRLALQGRGIALLPMYLCSEDVERGKLVLVLPDWVSEASPVHLVYPQQKFIAKSLRVFMDYLIENFHDIF